MRYARCKSGLPAKPATFIPVAGGSLPLRSPGSPKLCHSAWGRIVSCRQWVARAIRPIVRLSAEDEKLRRNGGSNGAMALCLSHPFASLPGCLAGFFRLRCHTMPADAVDLLLRSTGGGTAAQPALDMLAAFASVGVKHFDITWTNAAGGKVAFRNNRSLDELRSTLPPLLDDAARQQHNVIVRPRSGGPALIQLDDLDAAAEAKLRPVSFLTLRTSPGNYQAWVAVAEADAGFARRLRKGAGADPSASGATRVSGSWNFKGKYAPAFPRVETVHTSPGLVVTRVELETLGVVAPPEKTESTPAPARASRRSDRRGWPSYQRCVQGAPQARDGDRPDISRADFTFCLLAIDWGWGIEETSARLMQQSSKAKENGEAYARLTAENAAAALSRRHGQGR
jgi:hypothetical protein